MADQPVTGDMFNFGQGQAFGSTAPPPQQRGARDERFVQGDAGSGEPGSWKKGDNAFLILPPFSNYIERYQQIQAQAQNAGKAPEFPIGHIYYRLNIKVTGASRPRGYRVQRDNEFNDAFRQLYNALCGGQGPFSDSLKKIAEHLVGRPKYGFQPDCRFALNVLLSEQLSHVRWFDAPLDEGEVDEGRDLRIGTRIRMLFGHYWQHTPRRLPLFDLDECVPLNMGVTITNISQGKRDRSIWNYQDLDVMKEGEGLKIVNARQLMQKNVEGWDERMLDELEKWATTYDELPDFNDIPNLKSNGEACEILGLSTDKAEAPGEVQPAAQAPAQQPAAQAPAGGFGQQPAAQAPAGGFGQQPAAQAPAQQPAAQAPAGGFGQQPAADPGAGSVGGAFSTFDQNGAKAAQDFKAGIVTDRPSAQQPAVEDPDDEPPF